MIIFSVASIGQSKFGVKTSIGVSLAQDETTYAGEVFDYINHEVKFKGSNLVKSFGVFAQKKSGFLFARAEAGYTTFTQKYDVRSFVQFGQGTQALREKFHFVDLQILAGLTHKNLRLGVGPVAHILAGKDQPLDFISGYSEITRPLTWGFTTTVGLDAGIVSLDLRYENNFRTVGDHIVYGNRNARSKSKPHIVSLVLGVSF